MNLEQTALSLLEQFPSAQRANLQRREQMLERFGQIAFGGFGLVLLIGIAAIIYVVFEKFVMSGANVWGGLLLIAFVIFAALGLTYVVLNESLKEKRNKLNPQAAVPPIEGRETDKLLEQGHFEPAVSVTENTTELLGVENPTRKL